MDKHNVLKHILGQAGRAVGIGQMFTNQNGLCGLFQDHRVARDQRRRDGVVRGHIGVVPRCHDENHAMRFAHDLAGEARAVFDHRGRKRFGGDLGHMAGALLQATELTPVAHRAAHLMGELLGHPVGGILNLF